MCFEFVLYGLCEEPDDEVDQPVEKLYRSKGCPVCRQTGFAGRTGVYEVIQVTEELRQAISQGKEEHELVELVRSQGFKSMWEDALKKAIDGITPLSEVVRACRQESNH